MEFRKGDYDNTEFRRKSFNIFHVAKWFISVTVNKTWIIVVVVYAFCVLMTFLNVFSLNWDDSLIKWESAKINFEKHHCEYSHWEACKRERIIADKYPFVMAFQKTCGDMPPIMMAELNPFQLIQGSYAFMFSFFVCALRYLWKFISWANNTIDHKIAKRRLLENEKLNALNQVPLGNDFYWVHFKEKVKDK